MQVENIDGLTRENIDMLVEYIEVLTEIVQELPGGEEALGKKMLAKPELLVKVLQFVVAST